MTLGALRDSWSFPRILQNNVTFGSLYIQITNDGAFKQETHLHPTS